MADRMDLGNDKLAIKSSSVAATALKESADVITTEDARKVLNAKNVKYQEQLYYLKLELDVTRQEKRAVETRMTELFRDVQTSSASGGSKLSQQELSIQTLKSQIALMQESSQDVVASLKEEIRDLVEEKARTEMDLLNQMAALSTEKDELQKQSPPASEEKSLIQQLRAEKAALQEEMRLEREQNQRVVSALRQDKSRLSEQVEKMQGDLGVLKASVETVQSIDQMKKNQDESLTALEQVAQVWEKANATVTDITQAMEGKDGEEGAAMSTLENAALLQGQIKVSLMLIELKLRNTLMSLKNDASQLSIAVTDPGLTKLLEDAQRKADDEIHKVADKLQSEMEQLQAQSAKEMSEVSDALKAKMDEMQDLRERQMQLEKEIQGMSIEELGRYGRISDKLPEEKSELSLSRTLLDRLQSEVVKVVNELRAKNEDVGRLEGTLQEHKARERSLLLELKRLITSQKDTAFKEGQDAALVKLLEDVDDGMVEEVLEEEEVIEEEIIEEDYATGGTLGVMIEEEEVEEDDDDGAKSV
mmetsp:Transcript_24749/g.56683  ORF Transcript_24749/g.56683 Transcript_24749/m.56683 type:complete len:533 (+) Transcript_24749:226-1824(+)